MDELAEILHSRSKNRLGVTGRGVKERFVHCKTSYKRVQAMHHDTGFGITEADRKKGTPKLLLHPMERPPSGLEYSNAVLVPHS